MPVPVGTRITIRLPDDFHHHCRDGLKTGAVLQHATERFGRCLMMPNLQPPVTTTQAALAYQQHILDSMPSDKKLQPLMTLYLTDTTTPEEIHAAAAATKKKDMTVVGCKYYPAGATTNSQHGVTDVRKCYPALQAMSDVGMMLCIHSEVTDPTIDIFEREPVFLDTILRPLVNDFPQLKITLEHISTQQTVDYVLNEAPDTVKATITCHHLLYNRNHLLVGGIRPHLYCLPILKAEQPHRQALVKAAVSGSPKFFLGTDSAPHTVSRKETACGCAGCYTAHAAVELYAEVFDQQDALEKLEDFCSSYGADHYGLPRSTKTIVLEKTAWRVPETYEFGEKGDTVRPLRAGEEIAWRLVE